MSPADYKTRLRWIGEPKWKNSKLATVHSHEEKSSARLKRKLRKMISARKNPSENKSWIIILIFYENLLELVGASWSVRCEEVNLQSFITFNVIFEWFLSSHVRRSTQRRQRFPRKKSSSTPWILNPELSYPLLSILRFSFSREKQSTKQKQIPFSFFFFLPPASMENVIIIFTFSCFSLSSDCLPASL